MRGAWCQALSLPRPPVLWSGQPGFRDLCVPGAVGSGTGTQHRPHSVRPCGPALLALGVAEGRPRGGCLPPLLGASEVRRCPSPDCPPTGRASGARSVCAVCVVSVPCVLSCMVPLFSCPSGAPLSGVSVPCCARRVPAVPPSLCGPLARALATPCSFRGFVALYPFLYPSPWHALFPCLRFGACVGLFPCRLVVLSRWAFSFEPVKRKDVKGRAAAGVCRNMAPRQCHLRSVSYSCGGVVCYLFMLRSCAPPSFFLPCCACYGVFFRASFGVGFTQAPHTSLAATFVLVRPACAG